MTWSDLLKEYLSTATAFVITVFIVWALWNYTIVPIFPLFLHTLSYGQVFWLMLFKSFVLG